MRLREQGLYRERNPELPLDTINHKINQLSYYMFGYQAKIDGIDRFMFSPLGNLYLKNSNDKAKATKIFITMLWSVQYQHPHSGTNKEFQLYPFRLVYKLLLDKRLDYKLYAFEIAYAVVFEKEITIEIYENLVNDILALRKLSDKKLAELFENDRHTYVNSAYEWDYYTSTLFQNAGVLDKTDGETICSLQHGNKNTYRKITRNIVSIPDTLFNFVLLLDKQDSFLKKPLLLNDKERLKIDIIKEIYNFYPDILLNEIGEQDAKLSRCLDLPRLIEQYANNPENKTAKLFENTLVEGFDMFYNVEVTGFGEAGHTDIECLYTTEKKKFAVEAKSTANKLSSINVGRLREHREKIGGEYTIVVTPRYVPAAKRDIIETPNVIILARTFAEYLYCCIDNGIREIDYADFDNIIVNNLGKDISSNISTLTLTKFASSC
jgi:type II restriction enzyme